MEEYRESPSQTTLDKDNLRLAARENHDRQDPSDPSSPFLDAQNLAQYLSLYGKSYQSFHRTELSCVGITWQHVGAGATFVALRPEL